MPSLNRILDSISKIIRAEFANFNYHGIWEYAIQGTDGSTVDCDPTDTTIPLPSLKKVKLTPGLLGESVFPTIGKICYIVFVNGNPAKPICVSCEGTNKTASIPVDISLSLAGGGPPAARLGDSIIAGGVLVGTITSGSIKTTIG